MKINFRLIMISLIILFVTGSNVEASVKSKVIGKVVEKSAKVLSKHAAKRSANKLARQGTTLLKHSAKSFMKRRGLKSFSEYTSTHTKLLLARTKKPITVLSTISSFSTPIAAYSKEIITEGKRRSIRDINVTKQGIEYLPIGKKSIRTKWDHNKRGYVPVYEKSTSNVGYNTKLLSERRKSISPYNQFATNKQLQEYSKDDMEFGEKANSLVLKRNMFKTMDPENQKLVEAFGGVEAHHVIPGDLKEATAARNILNNFEIDINGPENGIFLPSDQNSIFKGTIHKTSHSPAYCKHLYLQLKDCKSREEAIEVLQKIKSDLYSGKLQLENDKSEVNKNIIITHTKSKQ